MDTLSSVLTYNYLHFCSIAFLYYDHIITLSDEVATIWKFPLSLSSVLFLLNRYFSVSGTMVDTVTKFLNLSIASCRQFDTSREAVLIVIQLIVGVLLLMRTYALYGRDIRVLYTLITVAVILIAVTSWAIISAPVISVDLTFGCHNDMDEAVAIHSAAAWEALFAWDALIFVLTVVKTCKTSGESNLLGRSSIATVMFRDGAIYFAAMVLANLSNIITYYAAPPLLKGTLATFASSVSVTMMSRLMLNLHKTANVGIMSTTPAMSHLGDLVFSPHRTDPASSSLPTDDDDRRWSTGLRRSREL